MKIRTATPHELRRALYGGFEAWPRKHYERGGAVLVHNLGISRVGAIPVRSPLTAGRLAQIEADGFEVVTRTPERYPEQAYVVVPDSAALEWAEVQADGGDLHPHTFALLLQNKRARIVRADDEVLA